MSAAGKERLGRGNRHAGGYSDANGNGNGNGYGNGYNGTGDVEDVDGKTSDGETPGLERRMPVLGE